MIIYYQTSENIHACNSVYLVFLCVCKYAYVFPNLEFQPLVPHSNMKYFGAFHVAMLNYICNYKCVIGSNIQDMVTLVTGFEYMYKKVITYY